MYTRCIWKRACFVARMRINAKLQVLCLVASPCANCYPLSTTLGNKCRPHSMISRQLIILLSDTKAISGFIIPSLKENKFIFFVKGYHQTFYIILMDNWDITVANCTFHYYIWSCPNKLEFTVWFEAIPYFGSRFRCFRCWVTQSQSAVLRSWCM